MAKEDNYQESKSAGEKFKHKTSVQIQEQYRSETFMSIYESPVQTENNCTEKESSGKSNDDSNRTVTKKAVTALAEVSRSNFVLHDIWMPNNLRRFPRQTSERGLKFWIEILMMIFKMLVLPTYDVGSDLRIAVIWFSTRRTWAISMMCPLIAHTICSAILWYYLEPKNKKKFSWIFVVFQIFPQYRAVSIIYHVITKSTDKAAQENRSMIYDQMIGTMEPFVESVPQLIIVTASFFSAWGWLTGNLDDIKAMEQVVGVDNVGRRARFDIPIIFYLSFGVSFISGALGITMFFKNGPIRFLSTMGLDFVVALFGTCCFIVWRLTMMAVMISSTGFLIPLIYSPPLVEDIMNGQCNTIVGVETAANFKLENKETEFFNSQWNCKNCQTKDAVFTSCNNQGHPLGGTCKTDCDCPQCSPFCSVWGFCQRNARYGRRPKTKTECEDLKKPPSGCWKPPTFDDLEKDLFDKSCLQRIWVRYELSNKTADWDSKPPFYVQQNAKYVIVLDQQKHRVLYSPSTEGCQQDKDLCEDWRIPQQLFCTEPVTAGLIMWIMIHLLPTFLFNLAILISTFCSSFFKTILHYPQLLFQGLFGTFLFGPLDLTSLQWGSKKLQLSRDLTFANFLLTLLQLTIGIFILSRNYIWRFIFENGQYIEQLSKEDKTGIQSMKIQIILSVVLLFLSWISSCFIFFRIRHIRQIDPRQTNSVTYF